MQESTNNKQGVRRQLGRRRVSGSACPCSCRLCGRASSGGRSPLRHIAQVSSARRCYRCVYQCVRDLRQGAAAELSQPVQSLLGALDGAAQQRARHAII